MGQLSWEPPPAAPAPPSVPAVRRRGRRVLTVLVMLALLAAAGAGTAIGWQQREVAAGWRDRAVLLEQELGDAVGRAEALSDQLGRLDYIAELAREDLATVEERLAELAGEKARAEERAVLTREELRTLAARVDTAVRQLNACADDLFLLQNDTVAAYNSVARGTPVDVVPLNDRLQALERRCSEARRAGDAAVDIASRLR